MRSPPFYLSPLYGQLDKCLFLITKKRINFYFNLLFMNMAGLGQGRSVERTKEGTSNISVRLLSYDMQFIILLICQSIRSVGSVYCLTFQYYELALPLECSHQLPYGSYYLSLPIYSTITSIIFSKIDDSQVFEFWVNDNHPSYPAEESVTILKLRGFSI